MDTTRLRELITARGPFASVYFESSHETADAEKQLELKWRALRDELVSQQASESALATLDTAIAEGERPVGTAGRALIATDETVLVDIELTDPPPAEARYSALPYILPLAEYGEPGVAHVVAVVDHIGVDLRAIDRNGQTVTARTSEGSDHPVHKIRGGAEAHKELQDRTEETVRQNIEKAADEVHKLATSCGAAFIVLAGEVQARKALAEALPKQARQLATEATAGGRADGASNDELAKQVRELTRQAQQERTDECVQRFRTEIGRNSGMAVQGLAATLAALRAGNVDTLLFTNPVHCHVFAGTDPAQLASTEAEQRDLGFESTTAESADEALPFAAVATHADLVYVGNELELSDGLAALCRHS